MKIDFSAPIVDFDGVPHKSPDDAAENLTLRIVAIKALCAMAEEDRTLPMEERLRRGWLAQKIHEAKEPIEIKSDDVTRVKKCIGRLWPPYTVFRALPLIDPMESIDK